MPEFIESLPEDLRAEPSLATFKDVGGLAKSYIEAQKLIGTKRIALPGEKATDAEWDAFYNSIGRPESVDKYEVVQLKDKDGKVLMDPDKNQLGELNKLFHKIGLTGRQAKAIQEYSLKYLYDGQQKSESEKQNQATSAIQKLREEFGDKFDLNIESARALMKKFGDEETAKFMDESGLGNNVPLVKLMTKIAASVMEDTSRRGGGDLPLGDKARAMSEIQNLTTDVEFQRQLGDAAHPGHATAAERWANLFKVAYPGVQSE